MRKMTLSEIAGLVGVSVVNLSPGSIEMSVRAGMISSGQGEKLLAELKEADGIWENPAGIKNAESLW